MAGIAGQSHGNPTAAQQKSNLLATSILLDVKSTRGGGGVKALAARSRPALTTEELGASQNRDWSFRVPGGRDVAPGERISDCKNETIK